MELDRAMILSWNAAAASGTGWMLEARVCLMTNNWINEVVQCPIVCDWGPNDPMPAQGPWRLAVARTIIEYMLANPSIQIPVRDVVFPDLFTVSTSDLP